MDRRLEFFTVGYGRWPAAARAAKLVACLTAAGVDLLIDIRHSASPSQRDPGNRYGPRPWHVLAGGGGIVPLLGAAGVGYLWAVELGNPQKSDPGMAVLKEHLADAAGGWPVHRGLDLVRGLVEAGRRCALLCACGEYARCHRRPIAEALQARLPPGTRHRDLAG